MGKPFTPPIIANRMPARVQVLQRQSSSLPRSAQKVAQLGNICLLVEACRLVDLPAKPFGVYVVPDFVVSGELESTLAAGLEIVFLLTAGKVMKHKAQHHTSNSNEGDTQ